MGIFGTRNAAKKELSVEEYGLRQAIKNNDVESKLFYEAQLDKEYQKNLRLFYEMSEKIEAQYSIVSNLGAYMGDGASNLEFLCRRHIGMAEMLSPKWRKYNQTPLLVVSYKRLAMIYEKQEKYLASAEICLIAIKDGFPADGTAATIRGRMARMVKKGGFEVTPEILEELNKPV